MDLQASRKRYRIRFIQLSELVDVLGKLCCVVGSRYTQCATPKKSVQYTETGKSLYDRCEPNAPLTSKMAYFDLHAGYRAADAVSSCSPFIHDSHSFNNFSNIGLQFFGLPVTVLRYEWNRKPICHPLP